MFTVQCIKNASLLPPEMQGKTDAEVPLIVFFGAYAITWHSEFGEVAYHRPAHGWRAASIKDNVAEVRNNALKHGPVDTAPKSCPPAGGLPREGKGNASASLQ